MSEPTAGEWLRSFASALEGASAPPRNASATPLIGDSSDKSITLSKGKRVQGATVEEWIELIRQHPDRTLPGGVGGAVVAHFDAQIEERDRQWEYEFGPRNPKPAR